MLSESWNVLTLFVYETSEKTFEIWLLLAILTPFVLVLVSFLIANDCGRRYKRPVSFYVALVKGRVIA